MFLKSYLLENLKAYISVKKGTKHLNRFTTMLPQTKEQTIIEDVQELVRVILEPLKNDVKR